MSIKDTLKSAVAENEPEQPKQDVKTETKTKQPVKKKEPKPSYKTYEDFPYEDLTIYAGIDCIVSLDLLKAIYPRISKAPPYTYCANGKRQEGSAPSILDAVENVRLPCLEFILDMEYNGIKYDVEGNHRVHQQMFDQINSIDDDIYGEIPERIDINSGVSLRKYLFDELGMEPVKWTPRNEPSTDGASLAVLADKYDKPWLRWIGKRNDIESLRSNFIEGYVEDHVKSDGRIHSQYNLTGTSSFRISVEDPNLANLPNPKHGYNLRELYTVEDGNVFITFDYSSAEVKILAALCRDRNLLLAIKEGLDFHTYSASEMYGWDYYEMLRIKNDSSHEKHEEVKSLRRLSKALTFGILYGSSARGIAYNLGIEKEEGQRLIDLYFSKFPGIKQYVEDTHQMTLDNKFVFTPLGQRKMEFGAYHAFRNTPVFNAAKRNAQNNRVQGLASTAGLLCFAYLNEEIKPLGGKSLCTVYDSIEIEAPKENAAAIIEKSFYILNDRPPEIFDWLDFPIGVDAEIGTNWGNVTEIHRGITQEEVEETLHQI